MILNANAAATLESRIAADRDDATAHYELAVLLLASRGFYEVHDARLLTRAHKLLTRAIGLDPKRAFAHAALGWTCYELERQAAALQHFREARRLEPNKTIDVFVAALLAHLGRETEAIAEIETIAPRHRVNLRKLRADIAKANFTADARTLLGGFIHARNFFRSALDDEGERIQNALDRGRKRRVAKEQLDRCKADQLELERSFDPKRVPAALRTLSGAASRYGVGDDYCRPLLMKRIPKTERAKLIRQADKLARAIDKWLNTFAEGKMSTEAAAFMYLLSGVEEIR